ncbi:MAG: hypothetical protein FWD83_01165 [Promicromonosporaceae bacterium]|nr:hypothetical protein [Promicromonosporaceae bacterium]
MSLQTRRSIREGATVPRTRRAARRNRLAARRAAAGTVMAAVIGIAAASTAFALWFADSPFEDGSVIAGDLELTVTGPQLWEEIVTTCVYPLDEYGEPYDECEDVTTATSFNPAADEVVMPGDMLRVSVPVQAFLQGDNLNAVLVADFVPDGNNEQSVTLEMFVYQSGERVAGPFVAGELGEHGYLVGSSAGVTLSLDVVIYVEITGDLNWVHQLRRGVTGNDHTHWLGGSLGLRLEQVRSGPGFSPQALPHLAPGTLEISEIAGQWVTS